ncbi:hypothetical protein CN356_31630, partial [Bacillus cereus]
VLDIKRNWPMLTNIIIDTPMYLKNKYRVFIGMEKLQFQLKLQFLIHPCHYRGGDLKCAKIKSF